MEVNLSPLLGLVEDIAPFGELAKGLKAGDRLKAVVAEGAKAFFLAALHRWLGLPLLVVTPHPEGARRLLDQLPLWCPPGAPLHRFPEPDALPYERLRPDITNLQERLCTLGLLARVEKSSFLILAPAWAIAQKTIPRSNFVGSRLQWRVGMKVSLSQLLEQGQALGYVMERAVEVPGEMSRRGGIVDIFPMSSETPFRLELWGNEIESIRAFDPASQRSTASVSEVEIIPAREMLVSPEGARDFSSWQGQGRERFEEELGWLVEGQAFPGQEFYAPLFNKGCFLDYLPPGTLLVLDEPDEIEGELREMERRADEIRRARQEELPPQFPIPYFSLVELQGRWQEQAPLLELSRWESSPADLHLPFTSTPSYRGQWHQLSRELKQKLDQGYRLVIVSQQSQRLGEILGQESLPVVTRGEGIPSPGSLNLLQGSLAQGWGAPGLWVLGDSELFGFTKERRLLKRRPVRREVFLAELRPGDYVVHTEYGIARYEGMVRKAFDGEEKEYLVLEYAQEAKLYVPSDQLDRVSRYIGAGGVPPALSRLGTQEWQRSKERVRQAAGELAQELLELYAYREVLAGFAFSSDSDWQRELEASFPYLETPDQLRAVVEVKADMEKPHPMDRLVCGDVGYGKTEVALRAAFKAVADGKQVAMLVPTTVLAQQHYDTFSKRLAPFPVKVGMLSRFLAEREQEEVVQGLKQGQVDICVGTHRLLQRDVAFKDLGLVIVDEEQRFGVKHKERLKRMRQEVDVLTLSATPIPRTLYMALTGVREMSPMDTPPEERLPIKGYVAEYDDRLVREAVLRELERGGQVFFVHNRVQTILERAAHLQKLLPEARITVGHGQMEEEELEEVMLDFTQGKWDVLVCTTIIESGLDIPNVNTLIVDESDKLGLTQLYQLRGRVGRGSQRAYAYFFYSRGKQLTPQAKRRLETIYEATELGAGFRIAMKDLEIRGAGNLLGAEQSGHIGAVGFDLYCQLLAEAMEEFRAQRDGREYHPPPPSPTLALPLPAYIPEEYIPDLHLRLGVYQRLVKVRALEDTEDVAQELADRFGPLPEPVLNLLYGVRVKLLGAQAGIVAIATEGDQIVLDPVEGKKLDKSWAALGIRVGRDQIRLDRRTLGQSWPQALEELLQKMGAG